MAASKLVTPKFLDESWIPWTRWKEKWEKADTIPECLGLLHSGFQTKAASAEEASERFRFYLSLADGAWTATPIANGITEQKRKGLNILANLALPFDDVFEKDLLGMTPATAEAVFCFFRPRDGGEGQGLASFQTPLAKHGFELHNQVAKRLNEKLLRWCNWVWRKEYAYESPYQSGGRWPRNPETIAVFDRNRVDVLDILHAYGNGKLEALLDVVPVYDGSDPKNPKLVNKVEWELFVPECITRLYELASRKSGLTGAHTSDKAAEAALVNGSSAAKVLMLVKAAQKRLGQK